MVADKLEEDQQIIFAFKLKAASIFVFMQMVDAPFIFESMVAVIWLIFTLIAISFIFDLSFSAYFLVNCHYFLAQFYFAFHLNVQ